MDAGQQLDLSKLQTDHLCGMLDGKLAALNSAVHWHRGHDVYVKIAAEAQAMASEIRNRARQSQLF